MALSQATLDYYRATSGGPTGGIALDPKKPQAIKLRTGQTGYYNEAGHFVETSSTPQANKDYGAEQTAIRREEAADATTRDAYDLQREQATAAGEEERMEALKRMAEEKAGQGFGKGSGMLEGAERSTDVEYRKALASRLGQIDVAELQAGEAKTEAEKARAFAASEAEKGRVYGKEMAEITQENTQELARLNQTISQENLTFTDALNRVNNTMRLKTDSAYAAGKAGTPLDPNASADEKAAYEAGKSGRSYDDYASERDAQIEYRKAIITALDPNSKTFRDELRDVYVTLGIDLPGSEMPVGEEVLTKTSEGVHDVIRASGMDSSIAGVIYDPTTKTYAGNFNVSDPAHLDQVPAGKQLIITSSDGKKYIYTKNADGTWSVSEYANNYTLWGAQ